jgi:hypothetical protein
VTVLDDGAPATAARRAAARRLLNVCCQFMTTGKFDTALPMRICSPSADDGCRHPAAQHHRCWVPAFRVPVRCRTPWPLAADVEDDTRRADIIPVMLIFTNFKARRAVQHHR